MSWWTKNRKKVLPAAGLLALQFIPGVGQAASGALGGLLGGGELGAAAGSTLPEAIAASNGVGQAAAGVKGGIDAALAAEGGSEMGLAGTKAISDAYFGAAAKPVQSFLGGGLGGAMKAAPMVAQGVNMMSPPQQPMPMPAPPQPPQVPQRPSPSIYGGAGGIYGMTDEERKRLMAQMMMQRGML